MSLPIICWLNDISVLVCCIYFIYNLNADETPQNRPLLYNFYSRFKYTWNILDELRGPVGSNHCNLFNEIIILVRGRYGVLHIKTNITGVGFGDRTASGAGWRGSDETGETRVGRGRQCMGADTWREGWEKMSQLVGNVQEYGEGYKEGGSGRERGKNPDTNTVWIV